MFDHRILAGALVFVVATGVLMCAACEKPSKVPPPADVASVLKNLRDGCENRDPDVFCKDFSDIMFTQGFTKDAYMDVIKSLEQQKGKWVSEVYLGEDKEGVHVWRMKFDNGSAKLVLVFNDRWQVTGLWFR